MTDEDLTCVRVDEFLPHPPATVWRALTEPDLLAQWLMPGDFQLRVGHRYTMRAKEIAATGFSGTVHAEVQDFDPRRMLRIGWRDADPTAAHGADWTITWTLVPEGRGTRLFLLHEGFDPDNPVQQRARRIMGGGWRSGVLRALRALLDRPITPTITQESAMSLTAQRFHRVSAGFLARIEAVPEDRWSAPSPCPKWTARDVVVHVINEQRRMLATVRGTEPRPVHGVAVAEMGALPEVAADAELAAAWREIGTALAEAIDDPACADAELPTPGGPMPFAEVSEALPEDVLIHTWDLARATGGDERLDPEAVAHVFERFQPMDEMLRQPWAFGAKLEPPADADPQTRLLCFVGRRP